MLIHKHKKNANNKEFKIKITSRSKKRHFIVIKKDQFMKNTIVNHCATKKDISKHMEQKMTELNKDIKKSTIVVGYFKT